MSAILKRVYHNGLWPVAEFEEHDRTFCLDENSTKVRIENLEKANEDVSVERHALACICACQQKKEP